MTRPPFNSSRRHSIQACTYIHTSHGPWGWVWVDMPAAQIRLLVADRRFGSSKAGRHRTGWIGSCLESGRAGCLHSVITMRHLWEIRSSPTCCRHCSIDLTRQSPPWPAWPVHECTKYMGHATMPSSFRTVLSEGLLIYTLCGVRPCLHAPFPQQTSPKQSQPDSVCPILQHRSDPPCRLRHHQPHLRGNKTKKRK